MNETTHLLGLLFHLDVKLIQRLDVVTRESDGHETDVLLADLGESLDRRGGLRALPSFGADLGLPRETPAETSTERRAPKYMSAMTYISKSGYSLGYITIATLYL